MRRLARFWADRSLRTKALAVAAVPLAALLVAALSFGWAQRQEQQTSSLVTHTVGVKAQLGDALTLLLDAETGVRGYLLTGQAEFLGPYTQAQSSLPATLDQLTALVADNPAEEARASTLRQLAAQSLGLLAQLRAAAPNTGGAPDVLGPLLAQSRAATDAVRAQVAAMTGAEDALLAERQTALDAARSAGTLVVGASLLGGLGGGLLAVLLLSGGIVERTRRLERAAHELVRGEIPGELPAGADEIGRLGATLTQAGTLLVQRERELQEARGFLEHLIATGPVLILRLSLPGPTTTYVSPNVERILGYHPEEVVGSTDWWRSHVHPDDVDAIAAAGRAAQATGAAQWAMTWRFLAPDDRTIWLESVLLPELDADGRPASTLVYCLDVSDRTAAEAELRAALAELDDLYNEAPCGYHSVDAQGVIVRMNDTELRWLGYAKDELVGVKRIDELMTPASLETFRANFPGFLERGWVRDLEFDFVRKDGTVLPVLLGATAVRDADGHFAMSRSTLIDHTARREAAAAREAARRAAEAASLAKSEFLSRMSHELRTPLNAVLGFAQLLEMEPLPDEERENVHHITRAGRHLLELINEVLDISRIESGQMTISPEPVAVGDLLDDLVALVGPLGDGRGVTVDASEATCARHVLADRQRLKQVLLNLLSNAIKYNREGGSVSVHCAARGDQLRLAVADTGFGIPPERLDRLFRPFERLGAEQGSVEGTGMGLALSKGLVEAMGGRIGVESALGVGSTFWVELALTEGPLERYDRTHRSPEGSPEPAGDRRVVLHIEDNLPNLKLVERILARRPELSVLTAMQGRLGLELAREHRPDVILLDLHLPDLSGAEVLSLLRTYPETRAIPVIVVSADATKTQITRLTEAGAFGYLTKPLDVGEFLGFVDQALAARA